MPMLVIEELGSFLKDLVSYLPPGLLLAMSIAFIEGGKYLKAFRHEFFGTLLMIACTFSAGKWIGKGNMRLAWTSHAVGVVSADYFGGGPHVNPAVTVSMWTLGKCSYTEGYVRIAAQLCGGLVSFPLYHAISNAFELEPFGGPEFNMESKATFATAAAWFSEFFATLCLCFVIYILNWELHFGKYHYIIKQTLTAFAIRLLIEIFPTAGPAMNPMLATAWSVFGVGKKFEFPTEFEHYYVYWVSPCLAAILASILYTIYAGGKIFGSTLPLGPLKNQDVKVKKS